MKLFIKTKPHAKRPRIQRIDDAHFEIAVREPPAEGKANQAVIQALSDYFDCPRSCFTLVRGQTSKNKIVEMK